MQVSVRVLEFLLHSHPGQLRDKALSAAKNGQKSLEVGPGRELSLLVSEAWSRHKETSGYLKGQVHTLRYSGAHELYREFSHQVRSTRLWVSHGQALTQCLLKPRQYTSAALSEPTPYEKASSIIADCSAVDRSELESVAQTSPCHAELLIGLLLAPAHADASLQKTASEVSP